MAISSLRVRMLGEFSLSSGQAEINDGGNRSRKVWLLLAYLIYCRSRVVTQEELVTLLWDEDESSSNPPNALKTMLHRARSFLDQLEQGAGHTLIVRQAGTYAWNVEVPLTLDLDDFDALCKSGAAAEDEEHRLESWLKALELYQGDFLSKLSAEPWVVPIAAYFHHLYLQTALDTIALLEQRDRYGDVARLCRSAVKHEPYCEDLYRCLMRALLNEGDQRGAIAVYEEMSELLFANFGIMPSDETRVLYREAIRTVNDRAVSPGVILEQLRESSTAGGALFCDYDFFKVIYHAVARSVERSGDAVHLALLSVTGEDGRDLPKRSLDRAMENLQEVARTNLRRGDIAARCSVSQFILLLPQANYENARMVCDRIIKAFCRQYPHSPALLHASVQPLEPAR